MADEIIHVFETDKCVVRIHDRKLSEAEEKERKARWEKALLEFYHAVQKNPQSRGAWPER